MLNFGAVSFLDSARKLAFKRYGHSGSVKFLHAFIYILLCCHSNFDKTRHHRVGEQIYNSVFHIQKLYLIVSFHMVSILMLRVL